MSAAAKSCRPRPDQPRFQKMVLSRKPENSISAPGKRSHVVVSARENAGLVGSGPGYRPLISQNFDVSRAHTHGLYAFLHLRVPALNHGYDDALVYQAYLVSTRSPGTSWNRVISSRRPRSLGAHEWSWDRLPCSAQFSKTNVAAEGRRALSPVRPRPARCRDSSSHGAERAFYGSLFVPPPRREQLIRRYGGVLDGVDDRSVVDDFTRHLGPRLSSLFSEHLMRNSL